MTERTYPLCLAPFVGTHTNTDGHTNPCCDPGIKIYAYEMYGKDFNKYYTDDEGQTWNSPHLRHIRKAMYDGELEQLPSTCVDCIKRPYGLMQSEYDAYPMYKDTFDRYEHTYDKTTGAMSSMPIVFMALTPSNKCNAACRMCFTSVSSTRAKIMRGYEDVDRWIINETDYDYPDEIGIDFEHIRRMILKSKDTLQKVTISGGDPIQWDKIDDLFDLLLEMKDYLAVDILSNGSFNTTPRGQNIYHLMKKFKNHKIHFSVDGVQESFEYIRAGLKWKRMIDNIEECRSIIEPHKIVVHTCLSNLTCLRMADFIKWGTEFLLPRNIEFSWNVVTYPYKSVGGNLPPKLKQDAMKNLFKTQVHEKFRHIKNDTLKAMLKDEYSTEQWNLFIRELEPVDKYFKRLDMAYAFPELLPYKTII